MSGEATTDSGATRRGRPRAVEQDAVTGAALGLLDEGGPAALSIRAVAARLGLQPNALYTYVDSRAALERRIVEDALGRVDGDLLHRAGPSRERILRYALALRQVLLAHPAVGTLLMTAPMDGPNALRVGEDMISALSEAGLSPEDATRGTYALIVQVVGAVALEVAETDGRPPLPPETDRAAKRLESLRRIPADVWPRTAATAPIAAAWITTEQFTWSLERLLDGLLGPSSA